jgi:folylpolyglutamate synthase/dihydropteroate synthase
MGPPAAAAGGAHNPAGAEALCRTEKYNYERLLVVTGIMVSRCHRRAFAAGPQGNRFYCVSPAVERAMDVTSDATTMSWV